MKVRTLGSGSSGNCLLVRTDCGSVLVDAGITTESLASALADAGIGVADVRAIVLTHAHGDHLGCARKLSRRWKRPLYASEEAAAGSALLRRARRLVRYRPGERFAIDDLAIDPIPLSHDSPGTCALVLECGGARFAIATDLGRSSPALESALRGCDAFLLEFNHDEKLLRDGAYPWRLKRRVLGEEGHLSNTQAAAALARSLGPRARTVLLGHLSEKNNRPELARSAARRALELAGRLDVEIVVAPRGASGPELELSGGLRP